VYIPKIIETWLGRYTLFALALKCGKLKKTATQTRLAKHAALCVYVRNRCSKTASK